MISARGSVDRGAVCGAAACGGAVLGVIDAQGRRDMMKLAAATVAGCVGLTLASGGVARAAGISARPVRQATFSFRVVATGLDNPWEVTWGPDGYLWVTEKTAGRVTRVRPSDGARSTVARIPEVLVTPDSEDGLLGMALHPDLLRGRANQYVYLAYTYDADPSPGKVSERTKIARYTYDPSSRTLRDHVDLLTRLPASVEHNSGRLVFGPDGKLYYTIGDQGNNQFDRYCRPILAQALPTAAQVAARDWTAYQGKVLRLNLDGSVPPDNPVLAAVRSHVFSYGHRNAQGLVFGRHSRLYSSEHGPKSDDEINWIRAGRNYGWPRVAGYRDDKSYVYANWSASAPTPCTSLTYSDYEIPPSVPTLPESRFRDPAYAWPLRTFYTVPNGFNFRSPRCAKNGWYFICWPTVAPSSLDFYDAADGVPGWRNSLLMPSLKTGTVYRVPLSADGSRAGVPVALFKTVNRYRDVALNPDRVTFYVVTDSSGLARDRSGRPTDVLENPGAILEFRYTYRPGRSATSSVTPG
jgi:PQQ-dependent dehydrogenase (s-GDH family)